MALTTRCSGSLLTECWLRAGAITSYGPATASDFARWLGCSPQQANRIWQTVHKEIEPILVSGKKRYILSNDLDLLLSPLQSTRRLHMLAAHDPYLGLQDRDIILGNTQQQKQIWQTVSNPGALLCQGEVVGMWKSKKRQKGLSFTVTLWDKAAASKNEIQKLCEAKASQQQLKLIDVTLFS